MDSTLREFFLSPATSIGRFSFFLYFWGLPKELQILHNSLPILLVWNLSVNNFYRQKSWLMYIVLSFLFFLFFSFPRFRRILIIRTDRWPAQAESSSSSFLTWTELFCIHVSSRSPNYVPQKFCPQWNFILISFRI